MGASKTCLFLLLLLLLSIPFLLLFFSFSFTLQLVLCWIGTISWNNYVRYTTYTRTQDQYTYTAYTPTCTLCQIKLIFFLFFLAFLVRHSTHKNSVSSFIRSINLPYQLSSSVTSLIRHSTLFIQTTLSNWKHIHTYSLTVIDLQAKPKRDNQVWDHQHQRCPQHWQLQYQDHLTRFLVNIKNNNGRNNNNKLNKSRNRSSNRY